MFLWDLFVTHSLVLVAFFLTAPSPSTALPVDALSPLQPNNLCKNGRMAPCICGKLGLRIIRPDCGKYFVKYANPDNETDPTLKAYPASGHLGSVECGAIIDPKYIADLVNTHASTFCKALNIAGGINYERLYTATNRGRNVVYVDSKVRQGKVSLMNGYLDGNTLRRDAEGSVEYLKQLEKVYGHPTVILAMREFQDILNHAMDYSTRSQQITAPLEEDYLKIVAQAIKRGQYQIPTLPVTHATFQPRSINKINPEGFPKRTGHAVNRAVKTVGGSIKSSASKRA